MFLELFLMFLCVAGFGIIFNVPKSEIICCGLAGFVSWLFYLLTFSFSDSVILATVVGAICGTYFSKELTYIRKMPLTVYVLPSILPLAPGYYIYNAMYSSVIDENLTLHFLLEAFKIAGSIGIGMSIGLIIPSIARKMKGIDNNGQING